MPLQVTGGLVLLTNTTFLLLQAAGKVQQATVKVHERAVI